MYLRIFLFTFLKLYDIIKKSNAKGMKKWNILAVCFSTKNT